MSAHVSQSTNLAGHLPMGTAPDDRRPISVDSRTVRRGGQVWLPVMGEFHFSRFPADLWRHELLLMRAGGIDVVATYLFWNHHEPERGTYRFDGSRDVGRFVDLCAELDLAVAVRIGPWSHGECRNGGFPDWLAKVDCLPRTDDPRYLELVEPYFAAIARELWGRRWAEGGPIVAVQVENELYDQPGHLVTLRAMAERVGINAPLWTATGWGAAQLPADVVLPLYGGYPEAFWEDASPGWARELRRHYFPTPIRDDHTIGADLRSTAPHSTGTDDLHPYATCELGGGMAIAYHRRPLVASADVSALALTKLASGSAWQGYYLYHGCSQRLDLPTTNQESHATGYPNDLPVINYDFQAPLGEYGQVRPSFAALRLQHLFLRDCGAELAGAPLYLPEHAPADLDDRRTPRWSVRWTTSREGGTGFLFVNNHQPHEPLPTHEGVRFELRLDDDLVQLPESDVDIPAGAHFVWPIGYDLGGVRLTYACAQPAARLVVDGGPTAVFVATAMVTPKFAFPAETAVIGAELSRHDGAVVARVPAPGALTATRDGQSVRVLVLTEADGLRLQRMDIAGTDTLVLCDDPVVADEDTLWVDTTVDELTVDFLPVPAGLATEPNGPFGRWRHVTAGPRWTPVKTRLPGAAKAPPARTGGPRQRASAPRDEDFEHAATYRLTVPAAVFDQTDEVLLALSYTGDVARAYIGGQLVADHFWFGPDWEIGLRRFAAEIGEHGLEIRILPAPRDTDIYVDESVRARFAAARDTATLDSARLVPMRRVAVRP